MTVTGKLESITDVYEDWKFPTRGSNVRVGNEACRVSHWSLVSHWNSGSEGRRFPVVTEKQSSILFLTCHQENGALFSLFSHGISRTNGETIKKTNKKKQTNKKQQQQKKKKKKKTHKKKKKKKKKKIIIIKKKK